MKNNFPKDLEEIIEDLPVNDPLYCLDWSFLDDEETSEDV